MKKTLVLTTAAALSLTLTGPAAAAKKPVPPTVTTPASRTIPWFECYDALEWVNWKNNKNGRGAGLSVSVRKPGYTQPIKGDRICGYMGSGTYNLRIRMNWEKRKKVTVTRPNYRWTPYQKYVGETYTPAVYEDWPFTCTMTEGSPPANPDGSYAMGWFACRFDNGQPWPVPEVYTEFPVDQPGVRMTGYANEAETFASMPSLGDVIPTVLTGRREMFVRPAEFIPIYETRYKRKQVGWDKDRVWKWVEAKSFYVNRTINVTVVR